MKKVYVNLFLWMAEVVHVQQAEDCPADGKFKIQILKCGETGWEQALLSMAFLRTPTSPLNCLNGDGG